MGAFRRSQRRELTTPPFPQRSPKKTSACRQRTDWRALSVYLLPRGRSQEGPRPMNLKEANAVLDAFLEEGLALGPQPEAASEAWYVAWRFVLRQSNRGIAVYSNLAVPPTLMPWEWEVVTPAALDALAKLLDHPDLEVPNVKSDAARGTRRMRQVRGRLHVMRPRARRRPTASTSSATTTATGSCARERTSARGTASRSAPSTSWSSITWARASSPKTVAGRC